MPSPSDSDGPRESPRVLIIRPTALGDVVRTVPALVSLRSAMPQALIDWLVHDAYADAIRHHPALDGVIEFPRQRFGHALTNLSIARQVLRWNVDLRRARYDLVFDLQGLARSGWFTWITGARRRIGFANAREGAWLGYNRKHHIDAGLHTVDRMLALIAAEGVSIHRDMRLHLGEADRKWLDGFLHEHSLSRDGYLVIAPTAQWRSKCWPIERYIALTRRLLDGGRCGDSAVLLASPREKPWVQPMLDAFRDDRRLIAPTTTIGQLMAVVSACRLFVGNDSAPLHMAVGFNRALTAIYGPTNPALVGPYQRDRWVVCPPEAAGRSVSDYRRERDDQSLIAQVSIDAVMERAMQAVDHAVSSGN